MVEGRFGPLVLPLRATGGEVSMATSSRIKVMISSRCNDPFPVSARVAKKLSEIRTQLKAEIEAVRIFGQQIYEVWINEPAVDDAARKAWEVCLDEARDCDVFIALFNGNAGWPDKNGTIGICHAEFEAAHNSAPGKVFVVNICEPKAQGAPKGGIHEFFKKHIERLKPLATRQDTEAKLIEVVRRTVSRATVKLVQRGARETIKSRSYLGPALD